MSRVTTDVVVVGAGAVGASVAYELADGGADVVLLDANPRVGDGCSAANAGLLTPSHVEPLANSANVIAGARSIVRPSGPFAMSPRPQLMPWMMRFLGSVGPKQVALRAARLKELAAYSLRLHHSYATAGLGSGLASTGVLDVYSTQKSFDRASSALGETNRVRVLDAAGARREQPSLGEVRGAVHHLGEAHCDGRQFVGAVSEAARRAGAVVRLGQAVTGVLVRNGRVLGVETTDGRIDAEHVVIAGGVGSSRLVRSVGHRLPMQAGKGYVIDVEASGPAPSIPISFKDLRVVATPYPDRLRICGTFELTGDDRSIDDRRIRSVLDGARGMLPSLRVESVLQARAGLRPCSPDGLPYIGRTRTTENLVFATGHGMWGLTLAPVTGRLVAKGILDEAPTLNEAALSPDRFRPLLTPAA
ncbi:FAD-dependent oxidoreductase [Nocardioidaceae bacterium SCSIO 66511]|nr:FAD-dependent oxidoreductase [Nocardioidaceae bacterium SCSIO 66511]